MAAKKKQYPAVFGRRRRGRPGSQNRGFPQKNAVSRQPDFGAFFHVKQFRRLRYEVRDDGNMLHDFAYLGSYINDARTAASSVKLQKGHLRIGLSRDCWELLPRSGHKLDSVMSRLDISPVLGIEWKFQHGVLARLLTSDDRDLWITDLRIVEGPDAIGEKPTLLRISGGDYWSLLVYLAPQPWRIVLRDLSTPLAARKRL